MPYPTILGCDVSGTVAAVGSNVSHLKEGDPAMAHCFQLATQKPAYGAFQHYTVVPADLAARIPSRASFKDAAVMPLAISTATAGLFAPEFLALPLPTTKPAPTGKALLIWGGSGSVGVTAVQLAAAAGVEVIATASSRNHALVKRAGAALVLDHGSRTIEDELVDALKGKTVYGAYDAIGLAETTQACAAVVGRCKGEKFVASVLPLAREEFEGRVKAKMILAFAIKGTAFGKHVWREFVPNALESGLLKLLPEALVVGEGLENMQKACDRCEEGVSAQKVVVTL